MCCSDHNTRSQQLTKCKWHKANEDDCEKQTLAKHIQYYSYTATAFGLSKGNENLRSLSNETCHWIFAAKNHHQVQWKLHSITTRISCRVFDCCHFIKNSSQTRRCHQDKSMIETQRLKATWERRLVDIGMLNANG